MLHDADQVLGDLPVPGVRALIHCQRGLLLLDAGRPAEGLTELDEAVRLAEHASPIEQIKMRMNRADTHRLLGSIRQAERDLTAAMAVAQVEGLAEFAFEINHNLGYVTYLAGDLPRALSLIPDAAQAGSDYARGVVESGRAEVLVAAGLVDEADRALEQACAALARTDYVQLLGVAELARAKAALLSRNPERAAGLSRSAADRFAGSGNARQQALAELVELQATAANLDLAAVVERAARLAETLAGYGCPDESRVARLLVASAELSSGRPVSVDLAVRRGEPIHVRVQARQVRARRSFAAANPRQARREVRTGLREVADYQRTFGSFDLQTSSVAHGADLAALAVTEDIAADRPAAVLDWLERLRAITGRVPEVRPPPDETTAAFLAELRWVSSQLADEQPSRTRADALRRRRQQLERGIRARSWTQPGVDSSAATPKLADLRAQLGAAALVAIFGLREQVHGLVVTARRCWIRPLGTFATAENAAKRVAADLDALAMAHLPEQLRRAARRSLGTGLRALDQQLLSPLELPDAPLVLLPAGRLAGLAWGLFPSLRGRPISLAPSATAWVGAIERSARPAAGVVAVAGPGLARAEDEVAAVARTWPDCTSLSGAAATGEAFLAQLSGTRLVHVAAHGRHQSESPLFSAIRLVDGPVVGYDLERLPDPPRQVVLSACDLGQATVRAGDEALGLTRALLHCGTSTVIAGVAKVSDDAAADLMVDYHRRLAAGAAPAPALAAAAEASSDPSPFVCFGAGW